MKKILIMLVAIFSLLTDANAQIPNIPEPGNRPVNCASNEQCVSIATDGKTLTLWYKENIESVGTEEVFQYYAIMRWKESIDLPSYYVYKSKEREFYIFVQMGGITGFYVNQKYRLGKDTEWDENPSGDRKYKTIEEGNKPSGEENGKRYSWKLFISGNISISKGATNYNADGAQIQVILDSGKIENGEVAEPFGPPIHETKNDVAGFDFKKSTGDDMWINETAKRIILYVQYTDKETGKKYEKTAEYTFPTDFTDPEDKKAKELDNVEINLSTGDEVEEFHKKMGEQKPFWEEKEHQASSLWENDVLNKVVCWMRDAFISIFYYEAKLSAWFLRRNY